MTEYTDPAMRFIKDPGGAPVHELTIADFQRIDIAHELRTHGSPPVRGRIVWGISGGNPVTPAGSTVNEGAELGLTYDIRADGSVHCSGGYEAVIDDGFITGFRRERT